MFGLQLNQCHMKICWMWKQNMFMFVILSFGQAYLFGQAFFCNSNTSSGPVIKYKMENITLKPVTITQHDTLHYLLSQHPSLKQQAKLLYSWANQQAELLHIRVSCHFNPYLFF